MLTSERLRRLADQGDLDARRARDRLEARSRGEIFTAVDEVIEDHDLGVTHIRAGVVTATYAGVGLGIEVGADVWVKRCGDA